MFRVYLLYSYMFCISKFMNPRSKRVCSMNGCEATNMFAIKAIMKEMPYTFLSITILITIFLFGYLLKVFEGPLSEVSGQNFTLFGNAMWNVVITMTTTGYGDIYPKSNLGRLVGVLLCFWGTFLVSFFVVTINNMLTFLPGEEKTYSLLLRLHFKEELKLRAIAVLNSAFKQRLARHNHPDNNSLNFTAMRKFRAKVLTFK